MYIKMIAGWLDPEEKIGKIWIAKFPSKNDDYDVCAWEMVEHMLAKACGINVPNARLMKLLAHGSTYLSERFDRKPYGRRLHMMSAMTLLSKTDGQTDGTSYLDIADGIEQICADPDKDLRELWKRIVFSALTSNADDHLRNHGFVLYDGLWHLSPAYDLNPVPYADSLSLNITEDDNRIILENVINIAEYFRISKEKAISCIKNMQETIHNRWRPIACQCGISEKEQHEMESSFSEIPI